MRPARVVGANPVLRNLMWSRFAGEIAAHLALVAVTVVTFDIGRSTLVGLAFTVRFAGSAVAAPLLTIALEGRPPNRVLAVARFAAVAGAGAALVGAVVGGPAVWAVIIGVLVMAVADMATRAVGSALGQSLSDTTEQQIAARAMAGTAATWGAVLGSLSAAVIVAALSGAAVFGATLVLTIMAAVLALRVSGTGEEAEMQAPVDAGILRALRDQTRTLRAVPVAVVFAALILQTFVAGGLQVFYAPLAESAGLGAGGVGVLVSAFNVGGVLATVVLFAVAGNRHLGVLVTILGTLWAAPLLLFAAFDAPVPVLLGLGVIGLANTAFDVAVIAMLQRVVPDSLHPRVFGLFETMVVVGKSFGSALAPLLLTVMDLSLAMVVFGGLGVAGFAALVVAMRKIDRDLPPGTANLKLLRKHRLFADLPVTAIDLLALRMQRIPMAAGDVIIREGEPGDAYYVIEEGRVAVSIAGGHIRDLGYADGFGEVALLRDVPRTSQITAIEGGSLLQVDKPLFLSALRNGESGVAGTIMDAYQYGTGPP